MKVLFIVPTFSRKGAGVMEAPKGLALALTKNDNLSVFALGLDDEYTNECISEWGSVRTYRRKSNVFGFSLGLEAILNEIHPDVIHIHGKNDTVFPIKNVRPPYIEVPGDHAIILTYHQWFNKNLPEIILGNPTIS